jgi:hypothetical protein
MIRGWLTAVHFIINPAKAKIARNLALRVALHNKYVNPNQN